MSNIDTFELYKAEPYAALFALMVAADHAANTSDENLRSKLERELIAIAELINFQEQAKQVDSEIADYVLESALKLAIRANDPRTTSHSLNSLLAKILHTWSRFPGRRAVGLSRTVHELPANQLHGAWTTVLLLRALRNK